MKRDLSLKFQSLFGSNGDEKTYFAPGRVNLIGEHIDYNGGHVFPCALTMGVYMVARRRKDRNLFLYSENFKDAGVVRSHLDDLTYRKEAGWTNYPKGVIWAFQKEGYEVASGLDLYVYGNIPDGSGLSSSAAVQVATGVMLKDVFGFDALTPIQIALMCQRSEHGFIGVKCGVMDQFAVAMGKKDHAVYLNTGDLSYEYTPLGLNGMKLVIASSNKKRTLSDSAYNERRFECEKALDEIRRAIRVNNLCDLTVEEFEDVKTVISNPVWLKRARHAVYEEWRTRKSVEALKNGDLMEFGRLMNESHVSLRDDYEVTGRELDTLVQEAWSVNGVAGSRMTGAGLGGCTVSVVREDAVENVTRTVGEAYQKKIGYTADFYVVEVGDGARIL